MYKKKVEQFKYNIRREKMERKFDQMRKNKQLYESFQENVKNFMEISPQIQNIDLIIEKIQKLINLSIHSFKKGNKNLKSLINRLYSQSQEQFNNRLIQQITPYLPLLDGNLKKYLIFLANFLQTYLKQCTNQSQSLKIQAGLKSIIYFNGIILKEIVPLVFYFPFKSLQYIYQVCDEVKHDKSGSFEQSVQLVELSLKYLVSRFKNLIISNTQDFQLFLVTIHSVTKIIEFFVDFRQQSQQFLAGQSQQTQRQDKQTVLIEDFYQILKSYNIQYFITTLINKFINTYTEYQNIEQIRSSELSYSFIVILSITTFLQKYVSLVTLIKRKISQPLKKLIGKFYDHSILALRNWKNTYLNKLNSQNRQRLIYIDNTIYKFYMTFLSSFAKISVFQIYLSEKQIISFCVQSMIFISSASNPDYQQVQNFVQNQQNKQNQVFDNNFNEIEFYFGVLNKWQKNKQSQHLQLLQFVSDFVFKYQIKLQQLFSYHLQNDNQEKQYLTSYVLKSPWNLQFNSPLNVNKFTQFIKNITHNILNEPQSYDSNKQYLFSQIFRLFQSVLQVDLIKIQTQNLYLTVQDCYQIIQEAKTCMKDIQKYYQNRKYYDTAYQNPLKINIQGEFQLDKQNYNKNYDFMDRIYELQEIVKQKQLEILNYIDATKNEQNIFN